MSIALWVLVAALLVTGLSPSGLSEEVHDTAAYAVLALIGAHLAGLTLHTLRHREPIAMAMIDGRKEASPSAALRSPGRLSGLAFGVVAAVGLMSVFRGFDARTGRLHLPGIKSPIELMEAQDDDEHREAHEQQREH